MLPTRSLIRLFITQNVKSLGAKTLLSLEHFSGSLTRERPEAFAILGLSSLFVPASGQLHAATLATRLIDTKTLLAFL